VPHRFDLDGSTVQRSRLPRRSREAADPLAVATRRRTPTAWARNDTVVLIADCADGESVAYHQEIVEIIGVEEDDVVAEAATVIRIPGLPPCLGRFWSVVNGAFSTVGPSLPRVDRTSGERLPPDGGALIRS
jgi:hypothetical protein